MTGSNDNRLGCAAFTIIGTSTLFIAGCGNDGGDYVAVGVVCANITTVNASAVFAVGVTAVEVAVPSEVEVSEVLRLLGGVVSCRAVLNSNGVLTSLEGNVDAYHVSGEVVNVIFVTGSGNSGALISGEVESGLEGILISSTCVDGVYCAAVVSGALHSHVDCKLVNASLVYVDFVIKVLGGLVCLSIVAVNVRECHCLTTLVSVAVSYFVVPSVVGATNRRRKNVFYSVDVVYAFTCKLCRKCIVEVVNVFLTVIVCVVSRDAFNLCGSKYAAFNGALAFCIQGVTGSNDNCLGCIAVKALVSTGALFVAGRGNNSGNYVAVNVLCNCRDFNLFGCAASTCNSTLTGCAGCGSNNGYVGLVIFVYVRRNVVGINCATSTLAIFAVGVSNYGDSFGLGFAAFAGVGLNAFCGAGCGSGYNTITPCVYVRRNIVGVGFTALTCAFYKFVFVSRLSSLGSSNFCGLFSCCFYRSSSLGGLTEQLVEHITRSDSEHHSNGKNQSQNAQNVLVFHT